MSAAERPNIVYFLVDNLGMGELSSYIGGLCEVSQQLVSMHLLKRE